MNVIDITSVGLEKEFGPVRALRGLDFEVDRGSTLAVVGPNGAGKSTLLRILAGLARPTRGNLIVQGEIAHQRSARSRVGYIGHATLLYPELTARENLLFTANLYGVSNPEQRSDQLLESQGLADVGNRLVAGFSRGMAQRVAIARGLVHDPSLVLLDEPFTGLDRKAAKQLVSELQNVRAGGRTVVVVTHDLARCLELADELLLLVKGKIGLELNCHGLSLTELESCYLEAVEEVGEAG